MITLKNVSKYYYQKGVIASGFTKLNLKLEIGEFVVITGESGSGKSTLLNVISGLDSYEEGEMYINGHETSHYTESDFEEYRRKYISNIFQNFNLVNSYTVFQNIELALLIHGKTGKEAKNRAIELIKQVGLFKYKNTKASKLSGGQKQRVAIARALANDTPIIIADEPTGNLDSKTAKDIMKLLYEISENKLVIIVTHNIELVDQFATRKIKMHDGRILEDKVIEKKNKDIKLYQGNAIDLSGFKDASFDVILLFGPMYHLNDFNDKIKALNEAKRVCKKDGLIFISYCLNEYAIITQINLSRVGFDDQKQKYVFEDKSIIKVKKGGWNHECRS